VGVVGVGGAEIMPDKSLLDTLRSQCGKVHEPLTLTNLCNMFSLRRQFAAIFACKSIAFQLLKKKKNLAMYTSTVYGMHILLYVVLQREGFNSSAENSYYY